VFCYPPPAVPPSLRAILIQRDQRDFWDPCIFDVDMQLIAHGTVASDGTYDLDP